MIHTKELNKSLEHTQSQQQQKILRKKSLILELLELPYHGQSQISAQIILNEIECLHHRSSKYCHEQYHLQPNPSNHIDEFIILNKKNKISLRSSQKDNYYYQSQQKLLTTISPQSAIPSNHKKGKKREELINKSLKQNNQSNNKENSNEIQNEEEDIININRIATQNITKLANSHKQKLYPAQYSEKISTQTQVDIPIINSRNNKLYEVIESPQQESSSELYSTKINDNTKTQKIIAETTCNDGVNQDSFELQKFILADLKSDILILQQKMHTTNDLNYLNIINPKNKPNHISQQKCLDYGNLKSSLDALKTKIYKDHPFL